MYNIGSTICVNIHPSDSSRNRPLQVVRLVCGDVGRVEEENIPSLFPASVVSWKHTSLDGVSAFFAINQYPDEIEDVSYLPPDEFIDAFPLLVSDPPFQVLANAAGTASALDFFTFNTTRDFLDKAYVSLRIAFGWWECTFNNSLGSQTETTFISDSRE